MTRHRPRGKTPPITCSLHWLEPSEAQDWSLLSIGSVTGSTPTDAGLRGVLPRLGRCGAMAARTREGGVDGHAPIKAAVRNAELAQSALRASTRVLEPLCGAEGARAGIKPGPSLVGATTVSPLALPLPPRGQRRRWWLL